MAAILPYLAAPGSITTALDKIKAASTPEKITLDFIKTILGLKGGTGNSMLPFLKRIGMVGDDGTPTDIYKKFRNPSFTGQAIVEAIKKGYKELYAKNEYVHALKDKELKGMVLEILGCDQESQVLDYTVRTFKNLKSFAKFNETVKPDEKTSDQVIALPKPGDEQEEPVPMRKIGMNLSYTINLNLPATPDIAVFNAIFKSLKENILKNED